MDTCHLCGRETTAHPANPTMYPVCECGDEIDALRARVAELEAALKALYALVQGESPQLLEDDHHDEIVRSALRLD